MNASDYLEAGTLDFWFTNAAVTRPTNRFIALYTTAPADAGGGAEIPTSAGYVRMAGTFSRTDNVARLSAQIEYPAATENWTTVTHWAVFDAVTGGNMLAYGAFNEPKTIAVGDILRLPVNSISITQN